MADIRDFVYLQRCIETSNQAETELVAEICIFIPLSHNTQTHVSGPFVSRVEIRKKSLGLTLPVLGKLSRWRQCPLKRYMECTTPRSERAHCNDESDRIKDKTQSSQVAKLTAPTHKVPSSGKLCRLAGEVCTNYALQVEGRSQRGTSR